MHNFEKIQENEKIDLPFTKEKQQLMTKSPLQLDLFAPPASKQPKEEKISFLQLLGRICAKVREIRDLEILLSKIEIKNNPGPVDSPASPSYNSWQLPPKFLRRSESEMLQEARFERISPALKVRVNKRARRMALRLDAKNRVVNLVIPARGSVNKAYLFAKENKDWINEKISNLPVPIAFVHGAHVPIFGKDTKICIHYDPTLKTTDIELKDNKLSVYTSASNPATRIRRFLQNLAREKISHLAHLKAKRLGRNIRSIQIRDTVSRWGSCSEDGDLSFSWRLIFAPTMAFDYVVAHEVAHLEHMDHSEDFWEVCSWLSRGYHVGKDWMRDHGYELMRYGTEFPEQ